MIYKCFDH